jgi:TonB-dependent receptor
LISNLNMTFARPGGVPLKIALAGASSALALSIGTAAAAQATTATARGQGSAAVEEIVVTGIRGSLQRNLDVKRDAVGVVDAITAEDIGKFPDANVAASLQRLPGVSIQRSGTRGEPTGITVRGFGGDFNETLFDGRRVSTATGGRSVDFSTIGADFVGGLSVFKTPDVTLSSSSIGATVNVDFPNAFDSPGRRFVATASGSMQDEAKRIVPSAGVLFSDTFANDTLGFLVFAKYTRQDTRTNRVYVSGWPGGRYAPCQLTAVCTDAQIATANRTIVGWFPQQYGATQTYTQDERVDGRISLQWAPASNVTVTLDNNYSRQRVLADSFGFGMWFNQTGLRNVKLDENGTSVDFTQANSQTDFVATTNLSVLETNLTGLNVAWDVSDNFRVDADAAYSKSWLNPGGQVSSENGDVGYGFGLMPNLGFRVTGDSRSSFPEMYNYGVFGNQARWADTSVIGSHVTVRTAQQNTDEIKQARLSGTWEQEGFRLQIGGHYLEDRFRFKTSNTFANNFWQAYSGYGPASGGSGGVPIPPSLFTAAVDTGDFIPNFSGALPPVLLQYDARDYQIYLESLGNPQQRNIPGFNYSAATVGTTFPGSFDLMLDNASLRDIRERNLAAFVRAGFELELAGMPFHFNAGLRHETTRVNSAGRGALPISMVRSTSDPTLLTVTLGPPQDVSTKSSYSNLLPSFDMKLELTEKLHLRVDASRTLTRPALNLLTPVLNVGLNQRINALTATGGAPTLRPYLADNYDAALEWYYGRNSYAAANVFVKHVTNFIVGGTQRQTINGIVDPTTGQLAQFAVTQQVNGPEATVHGLELAWQHVFGDSGFGFNANATLVDTNRPYDPSDISQSGFAITGLANSANLVAFYDKNRFEARVAINYREEYLRQFGQNQNTGSFGSEPTFENPNLQVDFSTSYQLTEGLNVFFEGTNIFNETQSTHGRFDNQLLDVFAYGRRFTAGARYRF